MTAQLQRLVERFENDPSDRVAFETLEEHHFLRGEWSALIPLYERHLAATEADQAPAERARLLYRMGQACEDGLHDQARALACYRQALELDSGFAPALRRTRAHHVAAGEFAEALALAEREAGALTRPEDRAALLAEIGESCLRAGNVAVAVQGFEAAIAASRTDRRALLGLAAALEHAGRMQEAAAACERAARRLDGAGRAAAVRALGRLLAGPLADPERALAVYEEAHRAAPDEPEWLEAMSSTLCDLGRADAAVALGEARLDLAEAPTRRAQIAFEIGRLYLDALEDPAAAKAWLARAVDLHEDGAAHLALAEAASRLGDGAGRTWHLERAMELGADIPSWTDLGLGGEAAEPQQPGRLERLRRAVVERPADPVALEALSAALSAGEHHGELAALLERRAALASADPLERIELLLELGALQEGRLGDLEAASDAYQMAFALDPARSETVAAIERVLGKLERHDELAGVLERAAAHAEGPRRAALLCAAGEVHLSGRADPTAALRRFTEALDAEPDAARALRGLSRAAAAVGDDTALLDAYQQEAQICDDPARLAVAASEVARLQRSQGRPEDGLPAARRWAQIAPDDRGAHETLALLLEESGLTDELAQVLERLDALLEGTARGANQRRLGWLHAAEGRTEAAIAAWRAALEHDPRDAAALEALVEALGEAGLGEELLELLDRTRLLPAREAASPALSLWHARALEQAGRIGEAGAIYRDLHAREVGGDEALEGLERTARATGDLDALCAALAERSIAAPDAAARDRLELELAAILDELGRRDEARALLARLGEEAVDAQVADTAQRRLQVVLEAQGDFAALCDRLEASAERAAPGQAWHLHARVAEIAEGRLADATRARRHLEMALAHAPANADLWRRLAALYDEETQPVELLAALEGELACATLQPGGAEAGRALALHVRAARVTESLLGDAGRAEGHWRSVLALDPSHGEACERLVARLEAGARFEEVVELLRARLRALEASAAGADAERRTGLRLRLADCLAGPLGRRDGAIATLEAARAEADDVEPVAERLVPLYRDAGRLADGAALCEEAAASAAAGPDRARWWRLRGDLLRAAGDPAGAARALERAAAECPEDRAVREALLDALRASGDAAPLAKRLASELARPGVDERALRLELVDLFEGPLAARPLALEHLARLVAIDPGDAALRERAVGLARALGCDGEAVALLRRCASDPRAQAERASLWARCGDLLAGSLGRLAEAIEAWRASLHIDAEQPALRHRLREALEATGRTNEARAALRVEWASAPRSERAALAAHGVDLAVSRADALELALWAERLVAEVPDDADVWLALARLRAEPAARERALAEAARCLEGPGSQGWRRDLQRQRALLLERELHSPGAAIAALEEARRLDPRHPEVLAELDRLYTEQGRTRELADVLAERMAGAAGATRPALARRAAACAEELGEVEGAAALWIEAARDDALAPAECAALLARAGEGLRASRRPEAWAQVAEHELLLVSADAPARAAWLRRELGRVLGRELGQVDRALSHLRALVDDDPEYASDGDREELLALLRAEGDAVELARRLSERLGEPRSDAAAWRELARLREERLAAPGPAADAWRELVRLEPASRDGWAGLRRCAERVGDWAEVARALEAELRLGVESAAAHWRRIGAVRWSRLADAPGAEQAFAAARAAEPTDLVALRALQDIAEAQGEATRALALLAEEIEALGDADPARTHSVWLRIAALASGPADDPARAAEAFARAAAIAPPGASELAAWACSLERTGAESRWREVFGRWCEHPDASPTAADSLRLAEALAAAGETEEADRRLEPALAREPASERGWRLRAALAERRGEDGEAARAWQRAAECGSGENAGRAYLRAATLLEPSDAEGACGCLERAVAVAADLAPAHAALAPLAERLGGTEAALGAALRALALAVASAEVAPDQRLSASLAGARAARALGRWQAAWELGGDALALAPGTRDALAARGLAALHLGAPGEARRNLEACLAHAEPDPDPAGLHAALARALEALSEPEAALARYGEALSLDPTLADAHAGRMRLLERLGKHREASLALAAWAEHTADPAARADRYVRAARLARLPGGEDSGVERWLRAALAAAPVHATAWLDLATCLSDSGRPDDALAAASEGSERAASSRVRSELGALRARILEDRGELDEALAAWRRAAAADPEAREAALAGARLLRMRGEWSAAVDLLRPAAEGRGDEALRADIWLELARLLAGPLEDVLGAAAAYDRAHALAPARLDVREARAALLAHVPERTGEAAAELDAVLASDSTRIDALRRRVRLARARGEARIAAQGLAVLRALGAASPLERAEAPERLDFPVGSDTLEDEAGEGLRAALAEVLAQARPVAESEPAGPGDGILHGRTSRAWEDAERALLGRSGLLGLAPESLGATVRALVADAGGGRLGRGARRTLRDVEPSSLAAWDFARWRSELRALAWARVVDAMGGDLRAVLCALLERADVAFAANGIPALEVDLRPWVDACPEARALLGRVVRAWLDLARS